jgi:histidine decarboxylase
LWNAKTPHNPHDEESYWGYMLSMGSTEGNMYALWNARDYLSGEVLLPPESSTAEEIAAAEAWTLVSADTMRKLKHSEGDGEEAEVKRPVAFFSEDTHYSFTKAVRILGFDTPHEAGIRYRTPFPSVVPSAESGQIDVDVLVERVRFLAEQGHPIFINFNLGSTIKGAYDNVREACDRLLPIFVENQLLHRVFEYVNPRDPQRPLVSRRRGFWINIDGALGAGYVPFMHKATDDQLNGVKINRDDIPVFDFSLTSTHESHVENMVSSIVMSGHKWAGAPWPCGIYMTRTKHEMEPPTSPQHIGSLDSTFAGSRNGFSPLVLWDHLAQHSYEDQTKNVLSSLKLAEETRTKLQQLEKELNLGGDGLYVHRSPLSLAVMFRKPADEVISKWSLSQAEL